MSHSTTTSAAQSGFWSGILSMRPSGKKTIFGSAAIIAVAVALLLMWVFAWSGDGSLSSAQSASSGGGFDGDSVPSIAPAPVGAPDAFFGNDSMSVTVTDEAVRGEAAGAPAFESSSGVGAIGSRQVISQGSMQVEVTDVPFASAQVRAIAEGAGGFVEQLSSYGVGEFQQSTITVRVPQGEFFDVFEQIKALGKVQNENAGTEDVTEQFIDLEARLKSAQREELSLLSLLDRANDVSDVLVIERELSRVRTDLERVQGQLNFLERRVDLATITVSLNHPQRDDARAPAGSFSIEASNVDSSVAAVKAVVAQVNGEVDQVYTSVQNGRQRAVMTVRVFPDDFNLAVATIEDQGSLVSKEIREGSKGDPVLAEIEDEEPNARIDIVFNEKESSNLKRNLAIFIPIGSVAALIVLGLVFYGAYRMGIRKED
ncbi:MAG: DUF4349 domain-containing protein [Chloroflexi bacterium]|nr:DUF4349 domain-containing protein [Chloroflexota bacterium]